MIHCRNGHDDQFAIAVARNKYGRFPEPGEVVHHLNGCKEDDRPENIVIMLAKEHNKLHAKLNPNLKKASISCRQAGLKGGEETKKRYGIEYYKAISRLGVEARRKKKQN